MYELRDTLTLGIFFNGKEFPLDKRINSLQVLHIVASTRISVPMLHLRLVDNMNWFTTNQVLTDACKITVVINAYNGPRNRSIDFRFNSFRDTRNDTSVLYEIDGYLDVPQYWSESTAEPFKGTTSAAIGSIAQKCGLTPELDNTTDSQVWFPRNLQYHEWARQLAERGYKSDSSCMQLGLSLDKRLIYKDVATFPSTPKGQFLLGTFRDQYITATSIQPRMLSGSLNHYSGYDEVYLEQNPLAAKHYRAHERVQLASQDEPGKILVASDVKDKVKQNRIRISPINPGNAQENYERGLYQNRRMSNLYSFGLDVVTPMQTDVSLMDVVTMTIDSDALRIYNGPYIIASKVIRVEGANYAEKFELVRKKINDKNAEGATEKPEDGELSRDVD